MYWKTVDSPEHRLVEDRGLITGYYCAKDETTGASSLERGHQRCQYGRQWVLLHSSLSSISERSSAVVTFLSPASHFRVSMKVRCFYYPFSSFPLLAPTYTHTETRLSVH
ncbi:hypothetical protein Bbelb_214510 [Branchiostoma belcheri]|nr:hypothetical protein Bbelb_214510 [Branchiostoma belcheri]